MKALILAGGGPKGLKHVAGREGSRSLLSFPGGTLLDKHVREMLRYFDTVHVVSDDALVGDVCKDYGSKCVYIEQEGEGIEAAICSGLSGILEKSARITVLYGDLYYAKGFIGSHLDMAVNYSSVVTVTRPLLIRGRYLRMDVDSARMKVSRVGDGPYTFAGLLTAPASSLQGVCRGRRIDDVIAGLAGESLAANIWVGEWVDIDTPWDYMLAMRLELGKLHATRIHPSASIGRQVILEGPVVVEADATIDHNAVIKGPAYVGRGAFIGAHSFLRDRVAVMAGARIGAYSEVKRSIVYREAVVGSRSYIADSVVGYKARVAPCTLTLNTPFQRVSKEILLTSTYPVEGLKVGAVISAGAETEPMTVLRPASVYPEDGARG